MIWRDDVGRVVSLPQPPARIVSLAPSMTENLFAIGAGKRVVGVTTADDYPPQVARLPRVGNFDQPIAERIRALRPDLIILDSGTVHRADMDNLEARLATPVYAASSRRYTDVGRQIVRLGGITGHVREAQTVAAAIAAAAAAVQRRVSRLRPVTVFIQVDTSALYAAGPGSFIDDLIRIAGGVNIVRGANPYPLVSRETLLAADPAVYILTIPFTPGAPAPTPPPPDPVLRTLAGGHVYVLDANLLSRPTPRLAKGLVALADVLHPKEF